MHAKHYISTRNDPKTEQKRNANNLKAMKKLKKLLGLPLVYAGVAILVVNDLIFDKDHTIYILTGANRGGKTTITQAVGLLFVLAGAASYVWKERRQSRY